MSQVFVTNWDKFQFDNFYVIESVNDFNELADC